MKRAQVDKAAEGPAEERFTQDEALEELIALGLVERVEEEQGMKRARADKAAEGPDEERFTKAEAKDNCAAYMAEGGRPPETTEELLKLRKQLSGLNKGEYRRSDGRIVRKRSEIFCEPGDIIEEPGEGAGKREFEEPSERVEIADTAEASQIQVPVDTIEAADEPFEESQLM